MTQQTPILVLLYGPSALGLAVLLIVCLAAGNRLPVMWASALSAGLDVVSFLLLYTLASLGSWGNSSAFDFPSKILSVSLAATAVLTIVKMLHLRCVKDPNDQ